MLKYIKNIKGLQGLYSYDEVTKLLALTAEELHDMCENNGIYPKPTLSGDLIFTCYQYLTLNNRLYRDQCQAQKGNS